MKLPDDDRVFERPARSIKLSLDFDPHANPEYASLRASLQMNGQINPIIVCEAEDGSPVVLDGKHRLAYFQELDKPVKCVKVPRPKDEAELLTVIFTVNRARRVVPITEKRETLLHLIRLTRLTQGEAAIRLGMSPAEASGALGTGRIPQLLIEKMQAAGVPDSSIAIIGRLRNQEDIAKAVEFACAKNADGKLHTRDQLEAFIARELKPKAAGRPRLPLAEVKGQPGAVIHHMFVRTDGDPKALLKELSVISGLINKLAPYGMAAVVEALKKLRDGEDRPAA